MTNRSRREFLRTSGVLSAGLATASLLAPRVHAAGDDVIKVALVGCGGRGSGAVRQALSTAGPTKLVALADFFQDRVDGCYAGLAGDETFKEKMDVPAERRFVGLGAFKDAIDAVGPRGVVLLCTAPAFRPIHVDYAVDKGTHVFMEKSFAVDAPGIRRIIAAGKRADAKNVKIASGLMSRHSLPLEKAVEQLHSGIIGDRVTCWAYRMHGPVGLTPRRDGESELAHQIRNYSNFTWVNGSFLLDWLIHNLDVCCWAKGSYPVSAQGMGGRQSRFEKDQLFDHYGVEYRFADGTRLFAQGRLVNNVWGDFASIIHGTTGCARIGEGVSEPKIYKGWTMTPSNLLWRYEGEPCDHYQREHDLFFAAIRDDKPYNESERAAKSAMVGILGRMACESGQELSWDAAIASTAELAPGLENLTIDGPAPVTADSGGNYPVAIPGVTASGV
ncbi:MAG: Gfo/Idh/MocA family protein [Thermoguttaceae bacterium]